ncbi:ABC transporter permease [Pseudonocardia sp. GCM10023141]|uniref:ABC transporter permease n=1 Tax=Pseudonocardia sp. GCM10023141 TaxID=3252653 RepID=UPI00361A2E21
MKTYGSTAAIGDRATAARVRRAPEPGLVVVRLLGVVLFLLTIVPIGFLIFRTFVPYDPSESGLAALAKVFGTTAYLTEITNSVLFSAVAGALATVLAATMAWFVHRVRVGGARVWEAILISGFALPPVLAATAWTALLAPRAGFLNHWWAATVGDGNDLLAIRSPVGLVFVLTIVFVPFAYLVLAGPFASLPTDDEEAALIHGCGVWRLLVHVTIPSIRVPLVTSFVLVFSFALQTFSVPLLLGEPAGIHTIPVDMYLGEVTGQIPVAESNALGLLLLVVGAVAFVLLWRVQTRSAAVTRGAGRASGRTSTVSLGRWRWPLLVLMGLYFLITVVLPIGALVLVSFMHFITPELTASVFTLDNYSGLFARDTTRLALQNTVVLSVVVATVGAFLALLLGYAIVRTKGVLSRLLDASASLPLAVPRLALAFGFLWTIADVTFLHRIANFWLLVCVVTLTFLGVGVRTSVAAMQRIGVELDEAAAVGGAPMWRRLLHVIGPMALPSLVSIWRTLFVLSVLEVDVLIFLYQGPSVTVSVLNFVLLDQGFSPAVFPLAVVQVGLCAAVVVLTSGLERLALRLLGGAPRRRRVAATRVDVGVKEVLV